MDLEYRKCGDYFIPNIVAPSNIKNFRLGKYGRLRLNYLKTNKKAEYIILQMENKLQKHLMNVDITATNRVNDMIDDLQKFYLTLTKKEGGVYYGGHKIFD